MNEFKIEIASVPDRENLVAEVWFKDNLLCEINTENQLLEIEFYFTKDSMHKFNYCSFIETLNIAKEKLLDNK